MAFGDLLYRRFQMSIVIVYARDSKRLADILEKVIATPHTFSLDFQPSLISRWLHIPAGRQVLIARRNFEKMVRALNVPGSSKQSKRSNISQMWSP